MTSSSIERIESPAAEIVWDSNARLAWIRYRGYANLAESDGVLLVEALTRWVGEGTAPFGVLADASQLRGTDGPYRERTSAFFRRRRDSACIAIVSPGPVVHIVVDMFRVATGVQLKAFRDEVGARAWLRTKGIAA